MNPNSSAMQMHLLLRHGKRRRLSPISILLGNNSVPYSFLPAKTCPPSCINLLHSSTILPPIQASALSLLHCSSIPPPFHVAPTLACLPSSILADSFVISLANRTLDGAPLSTHLRTKPKPRLDSRFGQEAAIYHVF